MLLVVLLMAVVVVVVLLWESMEESGDRQGRLLAGVVAAVDMVLGFIFFRGSCGFYLFVCRRTNVV